MVKYIESNLLGLSEWKVKLFIPAILFFLFPAFGSEKKDISDFFISCDFVKNDIYQHEAAVLTLTLHTPTPDIAFAEMIEPPALKDNEFGFIRSVTVESFPVKETINGKDYYTIPLKRFVVSLNEKGSYEIKGGKFRIGVMERQVYNDPFWGRRVAEKVVPMVVDIKPRKFRIKSVPDYKSDDFSGLVGSFKVETIVPRGEIILNQPATALIKISGKGLIPDDILPDYASAFKNNIRLKSMSESRDVFFDGKFPVSELILECEFIASSKDAEIGSVGIVFFNPDSGKFEKAASECVDIEVKSITSKIETIEI